MEKFMIIFNYNDTEYTATVTKSTVGTKTDYAIRPTSPLIISRFGGHITLFEEDGNFAINTAKDDAYNDFVDVLTNAIRDQIPGPAQGKKEP